MAPRIRHTAPSGEMNDRITGANAFGDERGIEDASFRQ
jgi:hypothetical protein